MNESEISKMLFRVTSRNTRHVHFSVFGANPGEALGKCGELCVCTPVFDSLVRTLNHAGYLYGIELAVEDATI